MCIPMFTAIFAIAIAKSLQLCPTLCDHIDGSPLGSPIPGILQARTLVLVNHTTQFKLCTRVYTTMYPAIKQFLLPENLLTNHDILECILWQWVWRIFILLNSNLVIIKCKLWE